LGRWWCFVPQDGQVVGQVTRCVAAIGQPNGRVLVLDAGGGAGAGRRAGVQDLHEEGVVFKEDDLEGLQVSTVAVEGHVQPLDDQAGARIAEIGARAGGKALVEAAAVGAAIGAAVVPEGRDEALLAVGAWQRAVVAIIAGCGGEHAHPALGTDPQLTIVGAVKIEGEADGVRAVGCVVVKGDRCTGAADVDPTEGRAPWLVRIDVDVAIVIGATKVLRATATGSRGCELVELFFGDQARVQLLLKLLRRCPAGRLGSGLLPSCILGDRHGNHEAGRQHDYQQGS
jgi:hypothetical protein